jgi:hypothetical protein
LPLAILQILFLLDFLSPSISNESMQKFFEIKKILWKEQARTIGLYYPKSLCFSLFDLWLGITSCFYNPYHHCRKFKEVYGETPLSTLHRLVQFLPITKGDCWLELGSGRGKGAAWISQFVGCQTIGIEKSPLFSSLAKIICKLLRINNLSFYNQDMFQADFSKATFVYVYSTCIEEEKLLLLTEKMKNLPSGAHVITISSPLFASSHLQLTSSLSVSFPWGETQAFIHKKG